MTDKKENVKWGQLISVITIVGIIFGFVWESIRTLQQDMTEVRVDLAEVKTDTGWLRDEWEKMTGRGDITLKGNLLDKMHE